MIVPSHMAWGYLLGSLAGRTTSHRMANPYLLLLCGALPDLDLLTRQSYATILGHHGVAHSWFFITLIFIPFFIVYREGVIGYFVAVLQHPLLGDFVTNEIPLLFPISLEQSGLRLYMSNVEAAILLEVMGFLVFGVFAFVSRARFNQAISLKQSYAVLISWVLLVLTIREAFRYYEPGTAIGVYAVYAFASSIVLFVLTAPVAIRFLSNSFRIVWNKGNM